MSVARRTSLRRPTRRRLLETAAVLALVVAACGSDDPVATPAGDVASTPAPAGDVASTPAPSGDVASTPAPAGDVASTPAPAGQPTTTQAAGPAPADTPPATTDASTAGSTSSGGSSPVEEVTDHLGPEFTWSDVLARLDAAEQSCVRGVLDEAGLDEAGLESAMGRRLFSGDFPVAEDAAMFACLAAGTANDIFVAYMAAEIESNLGTEVSDAEVACLRDWTADIDLADMVTLEGGPAADAATATAVSDGLAECLPDVLIWMLLAGEGVSLDELREELSEDEKTCLRELVAEADWAGLAGSADSDGSEEDAEAALDAVLALSYGLLGCKPDLVEDVWAPPFDDISTEEAMAVPVGEPVEGALDSADDSDLFVFEAVEGILYEVRVSPGSLADPRLLLYDADGVWLDGADDSEGSLAPLLLWRASGTGSLHVEVGGYGAGSYTLMIDVSDIDDHADSEAGATVAAVGERIEAVVDYDGDVDFFVFEAVEGETYDIEALPGTLEFLRLVLLDAAGAVLDADIGPADSPPLLRWEASSTGSHYVAVESHAFGFYGSYSLMITRR